MKTPRLLSALLALGLAGALVVTGSTAASAAVNTTPTPLNVLPSQIVSGTAPTTGGAAADAAAIRMAQVWKFVTSPATVEALKAQKAGTATPAQLDVIKQTSSTTRVPLGVGSLAQKVGGVATAYTGYQLGTSIGSVAGDAITTQIWGVDANSLVCNATDSGVGTALLSFFSGQTCAPFAPLTDQVINADAVAEGSYGTQPICRDGVCLAAVGKPFYAGGDDYFYGHAGAICMTVTGSAGSGLYNIADAVVDTHSQYGSFVAGVDQLTVSGSYSFCGVSAPSGTQKVVYYFRAGIPGSNPRMTSAEAKSITDPGTWTLRCIRPYDATNGCSSSQAQVPTETQGNSDPERQIQCRITTTAGQVFTNAGAPYRESEKDWSAAVPSCPTVPLDTPPALTEIVKITPGLADQVLWSSNTPAETLTDLSKGGKYQTCLTTVCQLLLYKNGVSCFDGADCAGWFADTNSSVNKYECKYADQPVALAECTVYKPTWESQAQIDGKFYADPVTGTPGSPSARNNTENASAPVLPKSGAAMLLEVEEGRVSCLPDGFTLNPIDWVLSPLKCAFAPRASVVNNSLKALRVEAMTSYPGQFSAALAAWDFKTPPSGCGGIPVNLFFTGTFTILSACPGEILAPVAYWSRMFGNVAIVLVGLWGSARYIGSAFGFTGLAGKNGDDE